MKFPSFHDCRLFLANSRWPKGTRIDIEATVVIPLKEATWSKMKVASSGANVGATSPMYWTRVSRPLARSTGDRQDLCRIEFRRRRGVAERLVCTEDLTTARSLARGCPRAKEGGNGEKPAIRAWRDQGGLGGRLVVDEVDRASGDALSTLLAVTDSVESARWRNPQTGEWVRPGPQFSVVMTSNIEDLEDIPLALRDRFPVSIRVDQPHPSALESLSSDLRSPALAGSLGDPARRVSLRSFHAFDQLRRHLGIERAARLVFAPLERRMFWMP